MLYLRSSSQAGEICLCHRKELLFPPCFARLLSAKIQETCVSSCLSVQTRGVVNTSSSEIRVCERSSQLSTSPPSTWQLVRNLLHPQQHPEASVEIRALAWDTLSVFIAPVSGAWTVRQNEGAHRDPTAILQEAMLGSTSIIKHQQYPALLWV